MTSFIYSNFSTILVALAVLAVVGLAVRSIIKDKKAGKSCSCGGSCSGCAGSAACSCQKAILKHTLGKEDLYVGKRGYYERAEKAGKEIDAPEGAFD